jgi:hypothetical protein
MNGGALCHKPEHDKRSSDRLYHIRRAAGTHWVGSTVRGKRLSGCLLVNMQTRGEARPCTVAQLKGCYWFCAQPMEADGGRGHVWASNPVPNSGARHAHVSGCRQPNMTSGRMGCSAPGASY